MGLLLLILGISSFLLGVICAFKHRIIIAGISIVCFLLIMLAEWLYLKPTALYLPENAVVEATMDNDTVILDEGKAAQILKILNSILVYRDLINDDRYVFSDGPVPASSIIYLNIIDEDTNLIIGQCGVYLEVPRKSSWLFAPPNSKKKYHLPFSVQQSETISDICGFQ